MVNGRPLYPSSDDIWEAPPITPNDLLLGHYNPPPQPEPEERTNPRQLLRSTQNRVADFWRSWMKYFAPNLLPRNKWFRVRDNIQIGDLVLELDPKHKRCEWKMARIVGTYPGNVGLVRKVRSRQETESTTDLFTNCVWLRQRKSSMQDYSSLNQFKNNEHLHDFPVLNGKPLLN